ncbi:hypothetical protein SS05631_c02540 [Sinorhizobium sp. CCBAU 05631]|nr:hypothetical protein SS05631_c02540 [Sinorhizobium sp. CCBAU 05631]
MRPNADARGLGVREGRARTHVRVDSPLIINDERLTIRAAMAGSA